MLKSEVSKAQSEIVSVTDFSQAEVTLRNALGSGPQELADLLSLANREIAKLRRQLDALRRYCDAVGLIEKRRKEIETQEFIQENQRLLGDLDTFESELKSYQKSSAELDAKITNLRQANEKLALTAELIQDGSEIGLIDGRCPLCNSPIAQNSFTAHLKEAKEMIGQKDNELSESVAARNQLSANLRAATTKTENTKRALKERQAAAETLNREHSRMLQEVRALDILLNEADATSADVLSRLAGELQQRLELIEFNTALLNASAVVSRMDKLKRDIEAAQKESTSVDFRITRLRNASEKAKHAADVIRRVTGEIVEERLAELSPLLGEIYLRLRPHVDWEEFSCFMRGDVRRLLSFEVGGLNPRFFFSSGQRRAAGLAFLLAVHLSRPWCRLETLVLDDPVQHIDDYRTLHLAETLSAVRRLHRQVICTVEDSALAQLLWRRMRSSEGDDGVLVSLKYDPGEGVKLDEISSAPPSLVRILSAA